MKLVCYNTENEICRFIYSIWNNKSLVNESPYTHHAMISDPFLLRSLKFHEGVYPPIESLFLLIADAKYPSQYRHNNR